MRMVNMFFGRVRRNDPVRLADPHPLIDYGDDVCTGDAGKDGFTCLSRAQPDNQGNAPAVAGSLGQSYQGPAGDWEQ